jgi:gliding motility-associated-like protein
MAKFSFATHYRAGEILFRNISGFNYEITVITYTDQNSQGDVSTGSVDVNFGDNRTQNILRTTKSPLINEAGYGVQKNVYKTTHLYGGGGIYKVCIIDKNRVDLIRNINGGQSVNVAFCVTAQIVIGYDNQSPILLSSPIDRGCVNKVFTHNPSAYDPDGDSLVFEIRSPKEDCDQDVPDFQIPLFSDSFVINQNSGQLSWSKPLKVGVYNIVIRVKEYRTSAQLKKPILVGYVDRDMQIKIELCTNNPPIIANMSNECVIVGDLLQKNILASDPDINNVTLTASGGPFAQKFGAAFTSPTIAIGNPTGFLFRWRPACTSIRAALFQADFKAVDNGAPFPLSNFNHFKIKVIGPAPKNFTINQDSNGFKLNWSPDSCNFAFGYKIYRRIDSSFWNPGCQNGVPASTGFKLLDTTQGVNNTNYFDNNNGKGLSPLINYCYRITSFYLARNDEGQIVGLAESSEGVASKEICGVITRTKPIITHVSVLNTDVSNGAILVKWLKPLFLDSIQFAPPYTIQLQRTVLGNANYINIGVGKNYNTFSEIMNDSLVDSLINTQTIQYNYKLMFYCTKTLNPLSYIDQSIAASSVYLTPNNTDKAIILNYKFDVPWANNSFNIFRKTGTNFTFLTNTNNTSFRDTGLINGQTYCYYITTIGKYSLMEDSLFNNSQEICGIPKDTIPPCIPVLSYISPCTQFNLNNIILNWTYPSSCNQDVETYKIYYRKKNTMPWVLIAVSKANTFSYTDTNSLLKYSIAGCYAVTAADSTGNESNINGNAFCIDNCPYYELPNVFTPNGDGINDLFKPRKYRFIEKIDFQVFNRWGTPVFDTENIDINWNGKDKESGKDLSSGVYFYTLKIYENYLSGTVMKSVRGTITIIRE